MCILFLAICILHKFNIKLDFDFIFIYFFVSIAWKDNYPPSAIWIAQAVQQHFLRIGGAGKRGAATCPTAQEIPALSPYLSFSRVCVSLLINK